MCNPIGVCHECARHPSFLPWQYKRQAQLKVVIFTPHFLDFEHLIEYPQLCLFHLACIISEHPPLPELAVYMPLEMASTKMLLSIRTRIRSRGERDLNLPYRDG